MIFFFYICLCILFFCVYLDSKWDIALCAIGQMNMYTMRDISENSIKPNGKMETKYFASLKKKSAKENH